MDNVLSEGRDAIVRHAWRQAFDLLSEVDSSEALEPEDLERLGEAAWWTGRLDDCIGARERAYAGYVAAEDKRRAARVALALAKDFYSKLVPSIGSGWLSRAGRLLEAEPDCVERGYLDRVRSVVAFEVLGDLDGALEHAQRAFEIAQRFGDL